MAFNGSANITVADGTKLPTAGGTLTGQLVSTRANDTANGGGQIFLNAADSNRLEFGSVGIGAPSLAPRSLGTKITFYPECSATLVDYGMGVDAYTLWSSVPAASSTFKFSWYGGTTSVATLNGAGDLAVNGTLTAGGNAVQQGLTSASTASGETALFVSPNTVRTLKAGNGIALSTASDVVSMRYAPHVAFKCSTTGVVSNSMGLISSISTSKTTGNYTFTLGTAHPLGANYLVSVTPSSTSFINATAFVNSSTSFTVYTRNSSAALTDSDFFVQTIP